jgi:hypothetical protein
MSYVLTYWHDNPPIHLSKKGLFSGPSYTFPYILRFVIMHSPLSIGLHLRYKTLQQAAAHVKNDTLFLRFLLYSNVLDISKFMLEL